VGGFFDPVGAVLFDLMSPLEGVVLGPSAVGVEHEFGVVAYGFAQDADELDVLAHALGAGSGAIAHEPFLIAIAFVFVRQGAGANGCGFEGEAETAGVHLHGGAGGASEETIDGDVIVSAADVPQRVVDRADGHHEEPVAGVAIGAVHLVPERFAGKRVLANQKGTKLVVDDDCRALFDGAVETVDPSCGSYVEIDRSGKDFF